MLIAYDAHCNGGSSHYPGIVIHLPLVLAITLVMADPDDTVTMIAAMLSRTPFGLNPADQAVLNAFATERRRSRLHQLSDQPPSIAPVEEPRSDAYHHDAVPPIAEVAGLGSVNRGRSRTPPTPTRLPSDQLPVPVALRPRLPIRQFNVARICTLIFREFNFIYIYLIFAICILQ